MKAQVVDWWTPYRRGKPSSQPSSSATAPRMAPPQPVPEVVERRLSQLEGNHLLDVLVSHSIMFDLVRAAKAEFDGSSWWGWGEPYGAGEEDEQQQQLWPRGQKGQPASGILFASYRYLKDLLFRPKQPSSPTI